MARPYPLSREERRASHVPAIEWRSTGLPQRTISDVRLRSQTSAEREEGPREAVC
jgi:hypothetical protein